MRLSGGMTAEHIYAEFQSWQASALLWEVLGRLPLATPTSRCPSPPGGQRESRLCRPLPFRPPSAARRERQARGASARRLRDVNDWRSGPKWGDAPPSLPPDHGAVQRAGRLRQDRLMRRESQQATMGGSRMGGCSSLDPNPCRVCGVLGTAVSPPPKSMTGVAYPEESGIPLVPLNPT